MEPYAQHSDLVDYLYQRLNDLNTGERGHPNVVVLRGATGAGKTGIVRELFNRLRSSRLDPYWPELTDPDPVHGGVGVAPPIEGPGAFTWPDNTLPTFSWWGLDCEPPEHGDTFDIVTAMGPQLSAHMPAYLLAYGREAGLEHASPDIGAVVREVRGATLNNDDGVVLTKLRELGFQGFQQAGEVDGEHPHPAPRDLADMILSVAHPGFPAIVVIQDLHRTGPDFTSLIDALTSPPIARPVLVVGTAVPGVDTDGHFSTWLAGATRSWRAEVRDFVGQPKARFRALRAAAEIDAQNYHFAGAIEKARHALALVPDQTTEQAMSLRHSLGKWLFDSRQLDKAVTQFEALLEDQNRILGPDHPDTLTTRNDLAESVAGTGGAQEALVQFEALLENRTRVLGPDHPDTLTTRENLAGSVADTGRAQEALALYEALLTDATKVLGPDHRVSITTRANRASHLGDAGQAQEAVDEYEAALKDGIRVWGPDHLDILTLRGLLARQLGYAGRVQEAVNQLEALLPDRIRVLGPDHPHTLTTRENLEFWRSKLD